MKKKIKTIRKKKSGVVYFAVNNRIKNMVKIGMTIDSAQSRLDKANRKNEFMCGVWSITQKVKSNDAKRTESLAQTLFQEQIDNESVSKEMFFIPTHSLMEHLAHMSRSIFVKKAVPK